MLRNMEKQGAKKQKVRKNRKMVFLWAIGGVILVEIIIIAGILVMKLPTVKVGEVSYNGELSARQIVDNIYGDLEKREVEFVNGEKRIKMNFMKAGVKVKDDGLVAEIEATRVMNLQNMLFKQPIRLEYEIDKTTLEKELNLVFGENLVVPVNATVYYNADSKRYEVGAGKDGQRIDVDEVERQILEALDKSSEITVITVDFEDAHPQIRDAVAQEMASYMNQRIDVRFNLIHGGKVLYFADPWDVAEWTEIFEDGEKYGVRFSKEKIVDFIKNKVSPTVRQGVVNQKVLVDKNGERIQILREGVSGMAIVNLEAAAEAIFNGLVTGNGVDFELSIEKTGFGTEKIVVDRGAEHWVLVDLSEQTTTLMVGEQAVQRFVISSGKAPNYTPVGKFRVWHKNTRQAMKGGSGASYYYLPNVRWNTFFTREGHAFHTAYWHNNFGHPMSHGCINMREAEAKVVYDFAPIGTLVVVQN